MLARAKTLAPTLFDIEVDTREQTPLPFGPHVNVMRVGLSEGDYTTPSLRLIAAIERKSLDDLVASLTFQRGRFTRELERLRPYAFKAIVVEGVFAEVACGRYRSRAHPNSIVGSICAIMADYSMPVVFAGTAANAATIVEKVLRRLTVQRGARTGAP